MLLSWIKTKASTAATEMSDSIWRAMHKFITTVNDANAEFADAFTVLNAVAGLTQQQGTRWRFSQYLRMDNLTNRNYVGSVIVNETNGRFYEPSPRRSMTVGVQAGVQF